jgi:hypothetical protein
MLAPQFANASKTAEAVRNVSTVVAAKDLLIGEICAVVPEPVLSKTVAATFLIKGAIFGLIAVGAELYDSTVDKKGGSPVETISAAPTGVGFSTLGQGGAPSISGFSSVIVDPTDGSLVVTAGGGGQSHLGPWIETAPPCGVVAVLGSGFSPQLAENIVLFDQIATAPMGFADLGDVGKALIVSVPSAPDIFKTKAVDVRVNVNRVLSDPSGFLVAAAPHTEPPGAVTKKFLRKSKKFLSQLIAINWDQLILVEEANQGIQLSAFERKVASRAGRVIVGRSREGLQAVKDLETALTPADIALLDPLLEVSLVIEALDTGINLTRALAAK